MATLVALALAPALRSAACLGAASTSLSSAPAPECASIFSRSTSNSFTVESRGSLRHYSSQESRIPHRQLSRSLDRFRITCSGESTEISLLDETKILELPCLPFSPSEVFVPSSSKTLHLYEARFLALLDEVMTNGNNLLAHIVIEPVRGDDVGVSSFVATYGCLARIESVRQMEIGALVSIRGISRIKMVTLTQMEPFIKSTVMPVRDELPVDTELMPPKIDGLLRTLANVQQLQIKIKTSKEEPMQTPLEKALQWAEKGEPDIAVQGFVPPREERISFAALQPIAGASPGELHRLLQERLKAMSTLDTDVRLANVTKYAEESRASVAAKVAIQSLQL